MGVEGLGFPGWDIAVGGWISSIVFRLVRQSMLNGFVADVEGVRDNTLLIQLNSIYFFQKVLPPFHCFMFIL